MCGELNFVLKIANVLEKLPKLFRKIMCGELDFALYEIAKILDIHISRPILFIKSITCGQCQKMKFENVTFSFVPFISTSIFPIISNGKIYGSKFVVEIFGENVFLYFLKQMQQLWNSD